MSSISSELSSSSYQHDELPPYVHPQQIEDISPSRKRLLFRSLTLLSVAGTLLAVNYRGGGSKTTMRRVGVVRGNNVYADVKYENQIKHNSALKYTTEALADEVHDLPGLPAFHDQQIIRPFRQFAGYLNITSTKHIFYWYFEAQESLESAPLTLWTNGGPACSGLFGLLAENGPFRPNSDGQSLSLNPYSWNIISNMLYVEIPVGVGFSYAEKSDEYKTGDRQTAEDNYALVQAFFARFPHLRLREFFLTSESYGGHYVPGLAKLIIEKNLEKTARGEDDQLINLQGFAVGNPYTDPVENMIGMFEALWGHSLIPPRLYHEWRSICVARGKDGSVLDSSGNKKAIRAYYSKPCVDLQNKVWKEIGNIDPYALDWPVCIGGNQKYFLLSYMFSPSLVTDLVSWGNDSKKNRLDGDGLVFEPCEDDYIAEYLNREDVKAALHVPPDIGGNKKWKDCTNRVAYANSDEQIYMEPVYSYLLAQPYKKLRMLIYSGDDDSVCGTRGTELWLDSMKWKIAQDWKIWKVRGQVAGYKKKYKNGVIFATVRGAGHEVPAYKPVEALYLFRNFLKNKL